MMRIMTTKTILFLPEIILQKDVSMKEYYEINVIIFIESYKSNLH